ncbi:hypothetical protein Tco_0961943 [Tanacetum coccineum]
MLSHCRIRVGNGSSTKFWTDTWIGDNPLCLCFPRIYALESAKECFVADKLNESFSDSFRRIARDVRRLLDDFFLPKSDVATRWVKCVPVKVNVFAWRVWLDRLPTRLNLIRRNVPYLGLYAVGGICLGHPSLRIRIGFLGSRISGCIQSLKAYWKVPSIYHGGVFGIIGISSCFRLRPLEKMLFFMTLSPVLLRGVNLGVIVLLIGIVGFNTLT